MTLSGICDPRTGCPECFQSNLGGRGSNILEDNIIAMKFGIQIHCDVVHVDVCIQVHTWFTFGHIAQDLQVHTVYTMQI